MKVDLVRAQVEAAMHQESAEPRRWFEALYGMNGSTLHQLHRDEYGYARADHNDNWRAFLTGWFANQESGGWSVNDAGDEA